MSGDQSLVIGETAADWWWNEPRTQGDRRERHLVVKRVWRLAVPGGSEAVELLGFVFLFPGIEMSLMPGVLEDENGSDETRGCFVVGTLPKGHVCIHLGAFAPCGVSGVGLEEDLALGGRESRTLVFFGIERDIDFRGAFLGLADGEFDGFVIREGDGDVEATLLVEEAALFGGADGLAVALLALGLGFAEAGEGGKGGEEEDEEWFDVHFPGW